MKEEELFMLSCWRFSSKLATLASSLFLDCIATSVGFVICKFIVAFEQYKFSMKNPFLLRSEKYQMEVKSSCSYVAPTV